MPYEIKNGKINNIDVGINAYKITVSKIKQFDIFELKSKNKRNFISINIEFYDSNNNYGSIDLLLFRYNTEYENYQFFKNLDNFNYQRLIGKQFKHFIYNIIEPRYAILGKEVVLDKFKEKLGTDKSEKKLEKCFEIVTHEQENIELMDGNLQEYLKLLDDLYDKISILIYFEQEVDKKIFKRY